MVYESCGRSTDAWRLKPPGTQEGATNVRFLLLSQVISLELRPSVLAFPGRATSPIAAAANTQTHPTRTDLRMQDLRIEQRVPYDFCAAIRGILERPVELRPPSRNKHRCACSQPLYHRTSCAARTFSRAPGYMPPP